MNETTENTSKALGALSIDGIETANNQKALGALSIDGIETANNQKALGALRSRGLLRSSLRSGACCARVPGPHLALSVHRQSKL
ncbi:hypothetical protein OB920_00330 [Halobacteria archaeon HArc-gm2]|nr:hypothetical protein [Halobacteria archaeon HArc-gm2]